MPEEDTLMRALRDMNMPKFVYDDVPLLLITSGRCWLSIPMAPRPVVMLTRLPGPVAAMLPCRFGCKDSSSGDVMDDTTTDSH